MNKLDIRIQNKHLHAISLYSPTNLLHFYYLLVSFVIAKKKKAKTLNQHLPFEFEHPKEFKNKFLANVFIAYGELLKKIFGIPLYWENAPVLEIGTWKLKYGQTDWKMIPKGIDLCLDTGHAVLNAKNITSARKKLLCLHKRFDKRIRHLHIHENDLISDKHWQPFSLEASKKLFTRDLFRTITKNRTYIFETPAKVN